jgi:hypothetical protein
MLALTLLLLRTIIARTKLLSRLVLTLVRIRVPCFDDSRHADFPLTAVKNGLERDVGIETSRWNPQGPKASEQSEGQTQEVQHIEEVQKVEEGQSPGGAHVSRRPVNFSFSAETAEKLRETTEKYALMKSFLAGKA